MAHELVSTGWGRIADITSTPVYPEITAAMLAEGRGVNIIPKAHANANGGVTGFVGYFCVIANRDETTYDWTAPFNFSVTSDLDIIVNSTAEDTEQSTNISLDVQGSIDGENWVMLQENVINLEKIDSLPTHGVYDIDLYGRMPLMRLQIQSIQQISEYENILIHVIPH